MKIKTQFLISIVIFSIILSIIVASVIITEVQTSQLNSQEGITWDVQNRASDLNYISNDYFLYQNSADISLWQTQLSALSTDLAKLNSTSPQQMALVNNVNGDLQNLKDVFSGVTSFLENAPRNESVRVLPQFQTEWSRLIVQNQALSFDTQQLSQNLRGQVDQSNFNDVILIVALLGLFGAFFITNYIITYRSTLKSISELQDGIGVIGLGNLDYSLKADEKDEIGEISMAFNQMTANLKNVTASKIDLEQAQASLRESEQRWATTLASIGDAVIATDTSGKIIFMNGEAEELTGWALGEASLKQVKEVFNIVNEQTHLEVEDPVSKVLERGMICGLANHTVLIRKNKTEVAIDDSGAPIKDKDGKTTGVVLIFRDITERKKAEDALRKSEEEYSSLFVNMIDGFAYCKMIFDENNKPIDFVYLQINDSFERITGLKRETIVGKKVTEAIPGTERANPELFEIYGRVSLTCKKEKFEIFFKPLSMWLSVSVYCPKKGYFAAIFEDITERKEAEEALARQAALIDLSPDAIIVRKLDGTITFWSKGAEKMYGLTKNEAFGQNINGLLKTEFPQPLGEILNKLELEGKWSGEVVHTCKNGEKVVVQSYWLGKFGGDGKIVEMLESNVDITDRIELQVKLEESAVRVEEYANQMEELASTRAAQLKDAERLATIGATAGMVGHDIRNPLQAITGDVFLAKTDLTSLPESEEKNSALESLQEIEKNVDYINKIVADLQDFARPLKPIVEETDLKRIIGDLLKKNGLPRNIKATVKVENDAGKVLADSTFINRILYNLVTNAVQAMPKGGKLTIHAYKEANDVLITVKDTGVGIPENVKDKLFTPMFTTKSKGQGFGLPVIKRMTESLGGTVTFDSQEGKGTTFIVRLPPKK
ncbi:MAG: PAS domain S-box protein [Candidatus Bathyarchaeia archaeon]|jgi:PAS domain S-box-containing protein